jgi:hypothetical protein
MMRLVAPRPWATPVIAAAAASGAAAFGVLVAVNPLAGAVVLGAAAGLLLTFRYPVANVALILALTAIVPFDVQNRYDIGSGGGFPGLLLADVLVLLGLCRVAIVYAQRARRVPFLLATALLVVIAAHVAFSLELGESDASMVGYDARPILSGVGTFLLALPLLEEEGARRRLFQVLLLAGLAVGLWGLAQYVFDIAEAPAGDVGVRESVPLTTTGVRQLRGGIYGFSAAIVLAFAVLASGYVRSLGARLAVLLVFSINCVALLLTYERAFWVATAVGCAYVALRAGRSQRVRVIAWGLALILILGMALAVVAPAEVKTARERVEATGEYRADSSYRQRVRDNELALDEVARRPLLGSGFGATITRGTPREMAFSTTPYIDNGYLWLAWKAGVPLAAVVTLLVLAAVVRRRHRGRSAFAAVRNGCQGVLLALLVVNVAHPSYNTRGITAAMGVMLAVCALPVAAGYARRRPWRTAPG